MLFCSDIVRTCDTLLSHPYLEAGGRVWNRTPVCFPPSPADRCRRRSSRFGAHGERQRGAEQQLRGRRGRGGEEGQWVRRNGEVESVRTCVANHSAVAFK